MQTSMSQQSFGLSKEVAQCHQMQTQALTELLQLLLGYGWKIEAFRADTISDFRDPTSTLLFNHLSFSESSNGQISFYGHEDFENQEASGWRFLETEILLPSAEGDEVSLQRAYDFLKTYTPIAINVEGDYAFLLSEKDGQIFEALAPDIEEVSLVATSLVEFVERLSREAKLSHMTLLVRTWLGRHG